MRFNKRKEEKPSHVISAWSREDGFCLGQKAVEEKSNEITAIPVFLDKIQVKGQIITIDAMGTQKEIAEKIRGKRTDYVLALKRNQASLYEAVKLYFQDVKYYQTEDIGWLCQKKEWKGLKSIGMEEKKIRDEKEDANTTLDK